MEKAIKKFRTLDYASKVNKEIINQLKINQIELNQVNHRIIEKGVLVGFSLPFI